MNTEIYQKIHKLVELITPFYKCKFVTNDIFDILTKPTYLHLWMETHKSRKELTVGFIPDNSERDNVSFGPSVRISRTGRNGVTYGDIVELDEKKISATYNGIIFIKKPDIIISRGPASIVYDTDNTIDVIPEKYKNEDSYDELKKDFPNLHENLLTAIYYFSVNPLPKGVQVEIVIDYIDMAILCFERLSKRIKAAG